MPVCSLSFVAGSLVSAVGSLVPATFAASLVSPILLELRELTLARDLSFLSKCLSVDRVAVGTVVNTGIFTQRSLSLSDRPAGCPLALSSASTQDRPIQPTGGVGLAREEGGAA